MKRQFNLPVNTIILLVFIVSAVSCGNNDNKSDAYGNFESDEVLVSAQSQGTLLSFDVREGNTVEKDQLVGRIDSSVAMIKKEQLMAQRKVIAAKMRNLDAQLNVQAEQRVNIKREVDRMEKLLKDNAATQQQFDDLAGNLKVLDSQTEALKTQRNIILGEESILLAQFDEVNDLLKKCRITSPIRGTILEKYADEGELVTPGKLLFKVASLGEMELKVFVSGSQLSYIAIGDTVQVFIDASDDRVQKLDGRISWISAQVEFTPKIIQTREERVNMVYAVKVRVKNPDGRLKIGMPGEVNFGNQE
jgi:HlyD family secretion protein